MVVIAWVSLLVAVGGLVVWFVASNPKIAEVGKIMFFCGLFWIVATLSSHVVRLG
jgi:Na+/phosphate symporter